MAAVGQDNAQWLSVNEEVLFIHDGLVRVTDLVELPHDINSVHQVDQDVVTFDSISPDELSNRLRLVCGTQNNAYARLLEYRLNALRGYWSAQHQVSLEEQHEREGTTHEETIAILKKQGLWKDSEQASFSTRMGLLLVLPLLKSQSKIDSALCGITTELLLGALRESPPLSLSKEPGDCLNGLEILLSAWLGEKDKEGNIEGVIDARQMENVGSALVALACARGHLKTFIHTVHLLQQLQDMRSLPVADIVHNLLQVDGGIGQQSTVLGSKHIVCWGFEDMLGSGEKDVRPAADKDKVPVSESEMGRSITTNGQFLYTTNSSGKGISKIGTGLRGTLRGYVYCRNIELEAGRLACGNGLLLHRPCDYDKESEAQNFVQVLDPVSVQVTEVIRCPAQYHTSGPMTTVGFCSDGLYFYWLWCPGHVSDKSTKGQNVFLETFSLKPSDNTVITKRPTIILKKKKVPTATLR